MARITSKQPIAFVAGKSGGHIVPCLAIAARDYHDHPILFFTTNRPLDQQIIAQSGIVDWHIPLAFGGHGAIRWYQFPLLLASTGYAFLIAFFFLIKYRPAALITTGGAVAIPAVFAAYLLRIPRTIYELNATPGKTTKLLAHFSDQLIVCFRQTAAFFGKASYEQYPVRFQKADKKPIDRQEALQRYGLQEGKKTIFILGGSQGSAFLNSLPALLAQKSPNLVAHCQFIHQSGIEHQQQLADWYGTNQIPVYLFGYCPEIATLYQLADLVICRAGAGTLFETLFFEKPIITIPLEIQSTSHQLDNAHALRKEYPGLISVIRQQDVEKELSAMVKEKFF